ncbi:MAG: hypothetical protein ACI82F_003838 [Planctomycetota bacterium]|jgi:hypothetical protein
MIRAHDMTDRSGDDAKNGLKVIKKTKRRRSSVAGDAAYDTLAIYGQAALRGARVVALAMRTESESGDNPRSAERDKTIWRIAKAGRRRWKKESGYHRQGTVKNVPFRYESILGDRLNARGQATQSAEVNVGSKM